MLHLKDNEEDLLRGIDRGGHHNQSDILEESQEGLQKLGGQSSNPGI